MKTFLNGIAGRRASRAGASATFTALLLAVLPATGQTSTPFTATGSLTAVPVPGFLCTNALGQVYLKGNVHVVRVQADDPRLTGRLQAEPEVAFQADGTRIFSGPAYNEVGIWDAAGTNFTRIGGAWNMKYRGVTQADGSIQYNMAGYGVGGTIDGLRVELTATRAAGATFDPAIPYQGTGTITPAPVTTTAVIDNFDDASPPGWNQGAGQGTIDLIQATGQLTIRGEWPGIPTVTQGDTTAWASPQQAWAVKQGQSLEAQVDLVSLSGAAPGAALTLYHLPGFGYWMVKGRDYVGVGKHSGGGEFACLSADRLATQNTNEVLVLALTPAGSNVILTARVLDKGNGGAVLYERSTVDTPASDPTLNSAEIAALIGITVLVQSDPSGAPWTSGDSPWIGVFQYTDGTLPAAEATFDNFELRTYEVPQVAIERAVQLTWPAPAGINYAVEGGPTVQGPWLPVEESVTPGMKQMTVPASVLMQFFRLQQAP
ncbi:MAG: hypothetical protein AB9869_08630 [Verrucomicrobiia bacterium]